MSLKIDLTNRNRRSMAGFSLIELLTVLLLLAIISAVSAPATGRFLDTISRQKKSRKITAALRYARLQAVSKGQDVQLRLADEGTVLQLTGAVTETRQFDFGPDQQLTLDPEKVIFYPEGMATPALLVYTDEQRVMRVAIDPLTALPVIQ